MNRSRGWIPGPAVSRLPLYLRSLAELSTDVVSSSELAEMAGVSDDLVRRDLWHLGALGTRGVGYDANRLASEIAVVLGVTHEWPVAILGVGNLGRALAAFGGFQTRGLRVAALFDIDQQVVGQELNGMVVERLQELPMVARRHGIAIVIIATPAESAQEAADAAVRAGITSILNFAPRSLFVPDDVNIRKVDVAAELEILAFHLVRSQQRGSSQRARGTG